MKITSLEIVPEGSSQSAVLSFRDPGSENPYNVKNITGLDADELVPKSYGGAGSFRFYNLTLKSRDVVFKIGLNPSFRDGRSYSDLRDDLYKMISASRRGKIKILFKNLTDVKASLTGFVSKFNNPLFEKTQDVEITVKCDDPRLISPIPTILSDLDPSHFILSDDESTAPHGFSFDANITDAIASLKITDPNDSTWAFEVIPSGGFLVGDKFHFSSEYNAKQLYLIRSSTTVYLGDVLVPGSVWPIIFPGINEFIFNHPSAMDWDTIQYYPTYWGV